MARTNRRLTRSARYGRYAGGPDPLAPPVDIAEALDAIGEDVMAGYSPERALREFAESSPSVVTPLNRYIGYEEAASIAKQALKERKTIREVVLQRGHVDSGKLTLEQLDSALDVLAMTHVND